MVISGKEDPDAALSPAMVAVMRLSKQVIGLPEGDEDDIKSSGAAAVNCCVRLLVPSGQNQADAGGEWLCNSGPFKWYVLFWRLCG